MSYMYPECDISTVYQLSLSYKPTIPETLAPRLTTSFVGWMKCLFGVKTQETQINYLQSQNSAKPQLQKEKYKIERK